MSVNNNISNNNELSLNEVYILSRKFIRENESKTLNLSYEEKNYLAALSSQINNGPENVSKIQPPGLLDIIGHDRRLAWQRLGNLSDDECRRRFISFVKNKSTLFANFIEVYKKEKFQETITITSEEAKKLEEKREQELKLQKEEEVLTKQIKQTLNEKTFSQFKKYSEEHYPNDVEKQGELIKELQEHHYVQYMQQLHSKNDPSAALEADINVITEKINNLLQNIEINQKQALIIKPPKLWINSELNDFKNQIKNEMSQNRISIGQGESITIRVPTHRNGSKLFWEFCTENYDLGFGLYFEPGKPLDNSISIDVSENDDFIIQAARNDNSDSDDDNHVCGAEDISFDSDIDYNIQSSDYGNNNYALLTNGRVLKKNEVTVYEIVPIFRRDCHLNLYLGCHDFPQTGYYLFKFVNTYSLWRSKILYYRIYYAP